MEKKDFKILFLDDEIYDEEFNPAVIAKEELENAGYSVEVTDKMSDVIDAYYKQYYHLYLLDIDMGKVEDIFEGNGTTVGETLRRLSSISNVVIYSAKGTVEDWVKAANYHFYYYVHKDWREEKLLSIVNEIFESVENKPIRIPALNKHEYSDSALIYYEDCQISKERFQAEVKNLIFTESLSQLSEMAQKEKPKLIIIALPDIPESMEKRKKFNADLKRIMKIQPIPNIILCIETSRQGKDFLDIVNLHPFRIIDIESATFEKDFKDAVEKAILWYGEEEIYEFPEETKIIRKPMSEQEIAALRKDDWDYDEFDEDEWKNMEEEND